MTTQPKAEHPCDACGGSGLIGRCGCWYTALDEQQCEHICPVCLGSGRISGRKDSSADGITTIER